MNKKYYSFGNSFKVKFRKHHCFNCGTELSIIKHKKIVTPKSEEAKYYDFSIGVEGGIIVGACEFIHKVFYCSTCQKPIEFVTQLSFEDIDLFINKLKQKFNNKGLNIDIKKTYETKNEYVDKINLLEDIQNLCLLGYKNDKEIFVVKFPLMRKNSWERPYYFKVNKKEAIKSIEKNIRKFPKLIPQWK